MFNFPDEERLSAYLDGELSPQEVLALEEQLAADPALRDQLQELRELSQSLSQLPRLNAPADLHQAVLASLPLSEKSTTSVSSLPHNSGSPQISPAKFRRWTGVISAGLILCLISSLLLIPGQQYQEHLALQENGEKFGQPALKAIQKNEPDGESIAFSTFAEPATMTAPVAPPGPAAEMVLGGQNDTQTPMAGISSPTEEAPKVAVVNLTTEEIRRKIESLKRQPLIGNSVPVPGTLSDDGKETPILVVFTVVDVSQAMNQMQVLLQRQQVRTADNQPLSNSVISIPKQIGGFHAVTVELEMDGPEMASVLNSVPALDAVMYLADADAPPTEPQIASEPAFSRASVPAVPKQAKKSPPTNESLTASSEAALPSASTQQRARQAVQFRFDQLTQELPVFQARRQLGITTPEASIAADSMVRKNQTLQDRDSEKSSKQSSPKEAIADADSSALQTFSPAPPARKGMVESQGQKTQESPRLKAFILLQQPASQETPPSMK